MSLLSMPAPIAVAKAELPVGRMTVSFPAIGMAEGV